MSTDHTSCEEGTTEYFLDYVQYQLPGDFQVMYMYIKLTLMYFAMKQPHLTCIQTYSLIRLGENKDQCLHTAMYNVHVRS